MKEEEIWKPITGFEGLYEVSSYGRVRSLDRYVMTKNDSFRHYKGRVLIPIKDSKGYLFVQLGRKRHFAVHRLVGKMFVPNPRSLPCINHIDECRDNNHYSNLEWCSHAYNNSYGTRLHRITISLRKNPNITSPVLRLDKQGNITKEYQCIIDTKKDGFDESAVSKCCRLYGRFHSHKGFIWVYKRDVDKIEAIVERFHKRNTKFLTSRSVMSVNIKSGERNIFKSLNAAHKCLGISVTQISKCCRGILNHTNGYAFKYTECQDVKEP